MPSFHRSFCKGTVSPCPYRRIVLPQAFPIAIPGMGNYLVGIFKDTPLLSTIGVAELFHAATAVGLTRSS